MQLKAVYNHGHTVDLLSKIQLETSGRFQVIFETMLLTPAEVRASFINRAVKGKRKKKKGRQNKPESNFLLVRIGHRRDGSD